jgi:hypothetical protein
MKPFLQNNKDDVSFAVENQKSLRIGSPLTIIMVREKCGVSYVSDVINSKSEEEHKKTLKRLNELLNI